MKGWWVVSESDDAAGSGCKVRRKERVGEEEANCQTSGEVKRYYV